MMNAANSKGYYRREIVKKYRKAGQPWPARSIMIARWALAHKLIDVPRRNIEKMVARDFAAAMREDYYTDPQNRRVRRKHVYPQRIERADGSHDQYLLWIDILDAGPKVMQSAFQYRRHQILGDCRQLKTDADSYNDNNSDGASIQMVFDFRKDLAESEEGAKIVAA